MQRLTALGFVRAVLAVKLTVTALPVRDAEGRPATLELTPTATTRGRWSKRGLCGYWSQRYRATICCHRKNRMLLCGSIHVYLYLILCCTNTGGTCGTSKLIAAIRTVRVAITHPGVDDASSRATVEAVGSTSRRARSHSMGSNTTYKGGDSSLGKQTLRQI